MTDGPADDEALPVSVRLGEVIPPEDPEDWTRPLTWLAALGMLLGPLLALAWFAAAPPAGTELSAGTRVVAAGLVAGAAATGATQLGPLRAATATAGAGLFGALATVVIGVVTAGERQVGVASPTLAHAFAASLAGIVGAAAAATLAAPLVRAPSRWVRWLLPALVGSVVGVIVVQWLA